MDKVLIEKHKHRLMENPECYKMLKEKSDGLTIGALKFPILFSDTIYLLPKNVGDDLVKEGWATPAKPANSNESQSNGTES